MPLEKQHPDAVSLAKTTSLLSKAPCSTLRASRLSRQSAVSPCASRYCGCSVQSRIVSACRDRWRKLDATEQRTPPKPRIRILHEQRDIVADIPLREE